MLKKIYNAVLARQNNDRDSQLRRKLMLHEAQVGGRLFGPVDANRKREFFCLDKHTWVWHEEWTDEQGNHQVVTTRYDVRPNGVLKSQNGSHYQQLAPEETIRLSQAAKQYLELVRKEVYTYAF